MKTSYDRTDKMNPVPTESNYYFIRLCETYIKINRLIENVHTCQGWLNHPLFYKNMPEHRHNMHTVRNCFILLWFVTSGPFY